MLVVAVARMLLWMRLWMRLLLGLLRRVWFRMRLPCLLRMRFRARLLGLLRARFWAWLLGLLRVELLTRLRLRLMFRRTGGLLDRLGRFSLTGGLLRTAFFPRLLRFRWIRHWPRFAVLLRLLRCPCGHFTRLRTALRLAPRLGLLRHRRVRLCPGRLVTGLGRLLTGRRSHTALRDSVRIDAPCLRRPRYAIVRLRPLVGHLRGCASRARASLFLHPM